MFFCFVYYRRRSAQGVWLISSNLLSMVLMDVSFAMVIQGLVSVSTLCKLSLPFANWEMGWEEPSTDSRRNGPFFVTKMWIAWSTSVWLISLHFSIWRRLAYLQLQKFYMAKMAKWFVEPNKMGLMMCCGHIEKCSRWRFSYRNKIGLLKLTLRVGMWPFAVLILGCKFEIKYKNENILWKAWSQEMWQRCCTAQR